MSQLASKFIRLKTMIGGNREKYGYEDTFGMPREEQAHITRPGRANIRIISELEFAINLSEAENGRYDGVLEEAPAFMHAGAGSAYQSGLRKGGGYPVSHGSCGERV